jgi:hypothetical protein
MIDGEKTAPAKVKILRTGKDESEFELTIHEGKKHQVRNMCQAVGNPVIRLRRLRQGPISLDNLRSADWRHLNDVEVAALQSIRAIPAERMPLPKPFPVKKPFRSPSSARPFKSMRSGSDTRPSEPLRSPADSRGSYGRPFARSADSAASPMGASRPSQQRRSSFIKPRKPAFTR